MTTKNEVAALLLQIERLKARLAWAEKGHKFIGMRDDDETMKEIVRWEANEPDE